MSTDFNAAAANKLVADRIQHATREEIKANVRAIMADPLTKPADYAACQAKLDLMSAEEGHSHTKVFSGGVWRELRPEPPSEAPLATRAKIREQLLDPQMPSKKQGELRAKLAATYEPERR